MAKLRVHELAKLVNKTSKEVLAVLRQQGEDIQSHMSTVSDEQASLIFVLIAVASGRAGLEANTRSAEK